MRVAAGVLLGAGAALAGCAAGTLPDGVPATAAATYRCTGGRTLAVRFDNRADTAAIVTDGRRLLLRGQRPASGIWYTGEGHELRGKGDDATFSEPGGHATHCSAARVP